jgi:Uma2 family endonuclease
LSRSGKPEALELRSLSNQLGTLQDKMQGYLDNGACLGWLIDPSERMVYLDRPGEVVERLEAPEAVRNRIAVGNTLGEMCSS